MHFEENEKRSCKAPFFMPRMQQSNYKKDSFPGRFFAQNPLKVHARDFPWHPARVVCHDILGQTALVDLAALREDKQICESSGLVTPFAERQRLVNKNHWDALEQRYR